MPRDDQDYERNEWQAYDYHCAREAEDQVATQLRGDRSMRCQPRYEEGLPFE